MSEKKHINVAVDPELHTHLKIACAQQSVTIASYVIEAIKEKLEKDAVKERA
jgi:predicted HicB family RNase H-like nuclease